MIDALRRVETPEGITLELKPAGPLPRALAWGLDFAIRAALYLTLGILASLFGRLGMGIFLVGLFLIEWFYPVIFEVLNQGQTPGKWAVGLRVLGMDGLPVTWSQAMVRSLLMTVDFLPVGYAAGIAAMLMGRHAQRLGDLAAGTMVVHGELRSRPRASSPARPLEAAAGTFALPLPLTAAEQRAVVAFAERLPSLAPLRAQELAEVLEPLHGLRGDEAVACLAGFAEGLRGLR
ncbi:MAG: RDD family protein [Acidobacteria bacterium ADurb.Bin340]|jgi:uncharacterized RDD family membrane protein YckC|nr:MAG: RDD family protein [Acidobacteria bacterium ADurb.Bin340]HQL47551.1 RDD family protein [Holophaga sp.]